MLKIRQTLDRIRHRPRDTTGSSRSHHRRFPKIRKKLEFFSKLKPKKKSKHAKDDKQTDKNGSCAEIQGYKSEGNDIQQDENRVIDQDKEIVVETNDTNENKVTITVECHDDDKKIDMRNVRSFESLPVDQLSTVSIGTRDHSRASMISQRSLSNFSMLSFKQEPTTRTIWTQTDLQEDATHESSADDIAEEAEEAEEDKEGVKTEVTCASGTQNLTPWSSVDFGVDNVFLREPVVNPKLASIRDRIVHRLKFPCLEHSDPEVVVDLLKYPKLPFLIVLNSKISKEGGSFNEEFIACRGLDFLLEQMEFLACTGLVTLFDVTKMTLLSECATSLVNSASGKDFIINHWEYVVCLIRGRCEF